MAEDDNLHEEQFESCESGASLTFPQQAGTIRKGGHICIKNRPCKVLYQPPDPLFFCERISFKSQVKEAISSLKYQRRCGEVFVRFYFSGRKVLVSIPQGLMRSRVRAFYFECLEIAAHY